MCWSMVTGKPQEFLGRSLCRTPPGYTFGVSCDSVTKLCKDLGFWRTQGIQHTQFRETLTTMTLSWTNLDQRRHRQLLGRLLWLDRPDIKIAVCQLSTHVGTPTTREEINNQAFAEIFDGKSCMQHDRWLQS